MNGGQHKPSLGGRCDEIMRLIDEALGPDTAHGGASVPDKSDRDRR
jgi:hypothetical protein